MDNLVIPNHITSKNRNSGPKQSWAWLGLNCSRRIAASVWLTEDCVSKTADKEFLHYPTSGPCRLALRRLDPGSDFIIHRWWICQKQFSNASQRNNHPFAADRTPRHALTMCRSG